MEIAVRFFIIISICPTGFCEIYTALTSLEEILQTETVLVDTMYKYVHEEQQKMELLHRYIEIYQKHNDKAYEDVESYVANPINAYLLVKRLTTDLEKVKSLIGRNIGQDFLLNISSYEEYMKFPTEEDLNGAAVALTRLQDTYQLSTASLARGELNGVKYSSELTATDCFELGKQSYNNDDFYHTQLWMQEAVARSHGANDTIQTTEMLEHLAYAMYKQGNIPLALNITNEILKLVPTHSVALENKIYYEEEMQKDNLTKGEADMVFHSQEDDSSMAKPGGSLYEQLCRGDIATPIEISSKLKCRFVNNKNPHLFIAPFKLEEIFLQPRIVIFHDVISDKEIDTIKGLARPRLNRATVVNAETGGQEFSLDRISKSAWLKEYEHKHISDLCKRVAAMTGLTLETAEQLQVVNYGIGGHYNPHFDFSTKDQKKFDGKTGNRIATILFYMSDVLQGGATVFPKIKIAAWPKKGTAVFWYNLHSSGEGDTNTLHGACPVLTGSKWVCNKWLHEVGQEFSRPCELTRPPLELTA